VVRDERARRLCLSHDRGLNTRRYYGLLVGGLILLAKLEETLILNGRRFELSANRYPGVVHPPGKLILPMQLKTSMMHSLRISSRRFRRRRRIVELTAIVAFENCRGKFNHTLRIESLGFCLVKQT
jgi:hypothetical protein